jgi:hypothetical protein
MDPTEDYAMSRILSSMAMIVATVGMIGGTSPAALAEDTAAATKSIWQKHLQSAMAKNVDAATSDFADDAVLFTKGKVFKGKDEIRGFVTQFVNAMTPEAAASFKVDYESYADNVVFFNFTVGAWKRSGTNLVILKDGKFLYAMSLSYPAE